MSQELKDIIVRLRMALIKEAGSKGYWEHATTADAYEDSKELVELAPAELNEQNEKTAIRLGMTREQYRLMKRVMKP